MEENYLIGLVIAFLFSFVLLKKDKQSPDNISSIEPRTNGGTTGLTGVSKYLKDQESELSVAKVTGVAKYLQEKESLADEESGNSSISGVAKYLASKEETPASGVSKYLAKKVIQSRALAKENASGVEKYLSNRN